MVITKEPKTDLGVSVRGFLGGYKPCLNPSTGLYNFMTEKGDTSFPTGFKSLYMSGFGWWEVLQVDGLYNLVKPEGLKMFGIGVNWIGTKWRQFGERRWIAISMAGKGFNFADPEGNLMAEKWLSAQQADFVMGIGDQDVFVMGIGG